MNRFLTILVATSLVLFGTIACGGEETPVGEDAAPGGEVADAGNTEESQMDEEMTADMDPMLVEGDPWIDYQFSTLAAYTELTGKTIDNFNEAPCWQLWLTQANCLP